MMTSQKPRLRLVLDFDGTITTDDTTAIIGARCLAKARNLASPELASEQLPKRMSHYSDLYFQQYSHWRETSGILETERKTIEEEVSFLSQARQVELDSFMRVREAVLSVPGGIGKLERDEELRNEFMMHVGREAVRDGDVKIRDWESLKSIIGKASYGGNKWGVVSVSWSRRFILGVLSEGELITKGNEDDVSRNIWSNELLAPLPRNQQGGRSMICSAGDKKRAFEALLADWNASDGSDDSTAITVYVGDSSTDLGCLAHASIGMYICEDRTSDSVVQTLARLGVECLPSNQLPTSEDILTNHGTKRRQPSVFLVKGFDEVNKWLSCLT